MAPEKRRGTTGKRTGFGRNVLPPPKVESKSSSYYSSDEDDKKPRSEGIFSPPEPGE